ncbi:type III PLP-dependent enzyme [Streptomyces sp. 900105755]
MRSLSGGFPISSNRSGTGGKDPVHLPGDPRPPVLGGPLRGHPPVRPDRITASHPLLVETLRTEGYHAEVSSVGETDIAIAGGYAPEQLLYSGPGKSASGLQSALAAGVRTFSVESVTDRDRLDALAERVGAKCRHLVRLNGPAGSAGGSLRMAGRPTAFGVDTTETEALSSLLTRRKHTRPVGLHTYFATNVGDEDGLIAEFQRAVHAASAVCHDAGFTPEPLDLGGGFPAPQAVPGEIVRHPRLAGAIENALDRNLAGWRARGMEVAFESGRYLVAAAGTLVTEVLDVKRSHGRLFSVLDAGVNALGGMSGLGRLVSPGTRPYHLESSRRAAEPETVDAPAVTLVGPLCTPLDVLNRLVDMGEIRVGDLLAVPNVGAYGLTASLLGFLSHPLPVEVVHTGGTVESVRRLTLNETRL